MKFLNGKLTLRSIGKTTPIILILIIISLPNKVYKSSNDFNVRTLRCSFKGCQISSNATLEIIPSVAKSGKKHNIVGRAQPRKDPPKPPGVGHLKRKLPNNVDEPFLE